MMGESSNMLSGQQGSSLQTACIEIQHEKQTGGIIVWCVIAGLLSHWEGGDVVG